MVALTGILAASVTRFQFAEDLVYNAPNGLAVRDTEIAGGIGVIFLAAGFAELENGATTSTSPTSTTTATATRRRRRR